MTLFEQKSSANPDSNLLLQVKLLREATNQAVVFNDLIKSSSRQVSPGYQQSMLQAYTRFFILYDRAAGNVTPKFHLMLHSIGQVAAFGSPKYFATYVDETFNGVLAGIAKHCHKLVWAETVFTRLSAIRQLDINRFAGFRT